MKKRTLILFVTLLLIVGNGLAASNSVLQGSCGKNAKWSYEPTTGALTISGQGAMSNYAECDMIPWNLQRREIKSLVIEDGITEIGKYAFYYCENLKTIYLPNSLTRIGQLSFAGCTSLSEVDIPYQVNSIEHSAFCYCRNLRKVIINSNKISIAAFAFGYCEALYNITLPGKPYEGISINAFAENTKLNFLNNSLSGEEIDNHEPALLVMVPNSMKFNEPSGNNAIDGNEECSILFQVKNEGKGVARNCKVIVNTSGSTQGISVQTKRLPNIGPGQIQTISLPIIASQYTKKGEISFNIEVEEPNGFGTDPIELTVATRQFEAPYIQIVDYAITGNQGSKLIKKKPFNLQLMLQNTQYGNADNIKVDIILPENVIMVEGQKHSTFANIKGGEAKSLEYELIVNNNYTENTIPIQVKITERYGIYSEDKNLTLQLNQTLASTKLTVEAVEQETRIGEIKLASIGSDVDKNIPLSKQQSKTTFAVIIANENYQQVAQVPFALNDGRVFQQYCEKTLGIPTQNIHFISDATINNIKQQVNWLSQVMKAYNGNARVIFYYAGHGVPDEKSKTAFLLPVDGNGSDITTGYKLDDLYQTLGGLPAQSITIFLDACFSGSKREEGMLASARGVAIKVDKGQPTGNMVVFSAATGDETAYPNNNEGHGMFTYYLLKKLQETEGDVTYEELGNYINQNVSQQSIVLNGKSQTPTIIASPSVKDWQLWKLK